MSSGNDQVVNQVLQRVLEALGRSGAARQANVPVALAALAAPISPGPSADAARKTWLTAAALAQRAEGKNEVHLAASEFPTPAAWDYAMTHSLNVKRDGAVQIVASVEPAPRAAVAPGPRKIAAMLQTLGLVVHRPDLKVEAVLAGLGKNGVQARGFDQASCWMVNTRALGQALSAGEVAGGVVIDKYAASAMLLAAKMPRVRPVQGVSPAAVDAGIRQFDANMLILGHGSLSQYEMSSMISRFAAARRGQHARTPLIEAVEQLEGRQL